MEEINELAQTEQVDNGEEGVCEAEEANDERLKMEGVTGWINLGPFRSSSPFCLLRHPWHWYFRTPSIYHLHFPKTIEIVLFTSIKVLSTIRTPLWVGARGLEFTWDYIIQGLEANANLMLSLSLAALGSLMWLRKNKPKTLISIIYACAGIVATMPSITSYLRWGLKWHLPEVVGFQMLTSLTMALISMQLFPACQKPSSA